MNNNGNHYRDFTHIDDLTDILQKLLTTQTGKKNIVFNLCTQKPIKLTTIQNILESQCSTMLTDSKINLVSRGFQQGDVLKSHGSNKMLTKCIGKHKFISIEKGLDSCINWFNDYHRGGYV
jgi:nucleoside-diphosphate-sugar epimerase